MIDNRNDNENGQVVYERGAEQSTPTPEFKPGNTPHTQFGNQTLNANVPWDQVVQEILVHKNQQELAVDLGMPLANVTKILKQNYRKLNFKTGARILMIHCNFYPAQYC
jgi:hypothetical protein